MHQRVADLYLTVQRTYMETHEAITRIRTASLTESSKEELADTAFALSRAFQYARDLKTELEKLQELCEKLCCLKCSVEENAETIRTPYVTATPTMKPIATLPKRKEDPEGYKKLMIWLGVPEHMIVMDDEEREPLRPHWPAVMDKLADAMEKGLPLPPGIDINKTWPKYGLTKREGKKHIGQ